MMETLKEIAKSVIKNVDFEAKTFRDYFTKYGDYGDMTMEDLRECISTDGLLDNTHKFIELVVALALV